MKTNDSNLAAPQTLQKLCNDVLLEKYAAPGESSAHDIQERVATALADDMAQQARFVSAQVSGFVPGGRVNSAAGMERVTTMINCFVQPIGDSMSGPNPDGQPGIMDALRESAETMRRGGGVGYDVSSIRPVGARVKGTDSTASGPVSYMRVFDRMCQTVESAGARRGAQMGVMRVDHPDIEQFIDAKKTPDFSQMGLDQKDADVLLNLVRKSPNFSWNFNKALATLSNFNISVAVTDEFMNAVVNDSDFDLVHEAEPVEPRLTKVCSDGKSRFVYRTVKARDIWSKIMRNTYNHAEPGVLFIDRINLDNNLRYCEVIKATNPCVTADTWIQTSNGPKQVADLIGQPFDAVVDGEAYASTEMGFFKTGIKPVLKLKTKEGYNVRLTEDHQVLKVARMTRYVRETVWVEASKLMPGDQVVLHNHKANSGWLGRGTREEGFVLGFLLGDGTLNSSTGMAVLSVWTAVRGIANGAETIDQGSLGLMAYAENAIRTLKHRSDFGGFAKVNARNEYRMHSKSLFDLANSYGMTPGNKIMTDVIEKTSSDFYSGFLRGLFDADGSVQGDQNKGVSVRLAQSNLETLVRAQRMLARLGIVSTIYEQRREAQDRPMPDGKGGTKLYHCEANHELIIASENMVRFHHVIGFAQQDKAHALEAVIASYKRVVNRERFVATILSLEEDGLEDVYDATIDEVHAFDANGLYVHNCGEQTLPAYGCCCLGSINLTRFVQDAFTPTASFDFDGMAKLVAQAVEMLDKVLDKTRWPLPQQASEAANKRRVGLGYLGLGDAMAMMGIRYDSQQGVEFAEKVTAALRDAAYMASVNLAKTLGAFPFFDAEKYLEEGTFASRLPEEIKDAIRTHGIRNSHLLSIAPTGTIALAFGDNASSGIEPIFACKQDRVVLQADGSRKEYKDVLNGAYRQFKLTKGEDAKSDVFVTAMQMSVSDHLRVLGAVAPYIDSAISKTVNVPADYPFEDFQKVYMDAWKMGLKGITTYRPNVMIGAVLVSADDADKKVSASQDLRQDDPDRRVVLKSVHNINDVMRWPNRPDVNPEGVTYRVKHPQGSFAVVVNHYKNGRMHPLEVFVAGAEQPRGLAAIAKSLSVDMRTDDGAWLAMKLDSLLNTVGDDGFEMTDPANGKVVMMPSLAAGFASLVKHRLTEIGALESAGPSTMMDALFSKREPKTGPNGALGWHVDINNPVTGDDFLLHTKEVVLPNGQVRPYSVWLSGAYPKVLDGLMKVLSIDMRVSDPAWVATKLSKLTNFGEVRGDFLAQVPGDVKQQNYPSTVAYVAAVLLARMQALGLIGQQAQLLKAETHSVTVEVSEVKAAGRQCPECKTMSLHKRDGCEVCDHCGFSGSCG